MFAYLSVFGAVGYIQRTGVAVAAERMMPELNLTPVELGWLLNAFLISYTGFQIPAALLGQRFGARGMLTAISLITVAAACSMSLLPAGPAGMLALSFLLLTRFVMGVAQSALYPVASGVLETWYPVRSWGSSQGLLMTGLWLGTAGTPPLVAWLMAHWGWRTALVASSAPSLLIVGLWYRYARNRPAEHPSVTREELEELKDNPPPVDAHAGFREALGLIRDRRVALLTLSYFLMNYVFYLVTFWCFIYLVDERHFTLFEGGGMASLPFIAAAVAAAVGGRLCDILCARYSVRTGMRVIPAAGLPIASIFLVLTGVVDSSYLAVAALSLAFAFTELTEGAYWAATMRAAPTEVMASTAVLNTGGNLGGVVATPTIAMLSAGHHWMVIFGLGAVLSVLAAGLWFFIDIDAPDNVTDPDEFRAAVPDLSTP